MKATICMGAIILSLPTIAGTHTIKKKVSIPPKEYALMQEQQSTQGPPITIWIHGTRFIHRPVFNTFFQNSPSLKLAQELGSDYHLHKIAKALNKTAPRTFPWETLYLFGWSGKLRDKVRIEAAEILYKELHRITIEYRKKYNHDPIIRIIGHSHGGNVALYLGKMAMPEYKTLRIKELVLLACPVQAKTKAYINSPIFEQTYAMYSTLDVVQVLAPQFVYNVYRTKRGHLRTEMKWNILSGHRFDPHPKLAQVKIKVNGRALFHSEFSNYRFVTLLPHILHVINTWNIDITHPPDTKKLLCVYTRQEQKANERKKRVRA